LEPTLWNYPEVQMKFIVEDGRADARGREASSTGFWTGILLLVFIGLGIFVAFKLASSLLGV
jgi:hypothetical protein